MESKHPSVILGFIFVLSAPGIRTAESHSREDYCLAPELSNALTGKTDWCRSGTTQPSEFGGLSTFLQRHASQVRHGRCRKQLLTLSAALDNSSLWAVQMLDSSAKITDVLFASGTYHLGHFDECIEINLERGDGHIRGKYCLADVELPTSGRLHRFGICVPDECRPRDVENLFRTYYAAVLDNYNIAVRENACVTNEPPVEKLGSTFFRYTVLVLAVITAAVSITDLFCLKAEVTGSGGHWDEAAEAFSIYRNIQKLTNAEGKERVSGAHLSKVAAIIALIILGRYELLKTAPIKNGAHFLKQNVSPAAVYDALIFISGFLTIQKLQTDSASGERKCLRTWVTRWLRWAPLYIFAMEFHAAIFEGIANGPLWVEKIGTESRHCRDVWWANLSFINNYFSAGRQCISQSWYFAVVAHCSLATFAFAHLKTRRAFLEMAALAVLVAAAIVLFVWNDFVLATRRHVQYNQNEILRDLYIKTHNRAPAYIIGVLSSLLCNSIPRSKERLSWIHVISTFVMFTAMGFLSVLSISLLRKEDIESKILYATTSSVALSLFTGCLTVISSMYRFSFFNSKLLKNTFIPLSRLSYPALLAHTVIQLYTIGTMRTPEYVTHPRLLWMASADILSSYAFALLIHFIIQAPVSTIISKTLGKKGCDRKPGDPSQD